MARTQKGSLWAKVTFSLILSASALGMSTLAQAQLAKDGERMPASMGAFGDSMTAAALGAFRRSEFWMPWNEFVIFVKLVGLGLSGDNEYISNRSKSWAAGWDKSNDVFSHSRRLTEMQYLKKQIPTYNAAVSGHQSEDVVGSQIAKMNDWSRANLKQEFPDYVTLMIGPNDICAESTREMVPVSTYYSNVVRVVDEVLTKSPNSKMLVGSIPNIESLRAVARNAKLHVGLSCEKLWKTIKLCPTLTTEDNPQERAIIAQRVIEYNQALRDIVQTRRDIFGDRIRYAKKTYEVAFTKDHLSVDCFHPNPEGQALLADVTFESSWWADKWTKRKAEIDAEIKRRKAAECRLKRARAGNHARAIPGC